MCHLSQSVHEQDSSIRLILFLKACSVSNLLTSLLNFDQRTGPKYLMLCLPKEQILLSWPHTFLIKVLGRSHLNIKKIHLG